MGDDLSEGSAPTRCCFAGHRNAYGGDIQEKFMQTAEKLITQHGVTEFWVGHYGDSDRAASAAIRSLKMRYDGIKLFLVLPYLTQQVNYNHRYYKDKYDALLMAEIPETTPKPYQIIKANEYMVDHCGFLICYVKYSYGGAVRTLNYARKKKHIQTMNVAEE